MFSLASMLVRRESLQYGSKVITLDSHSLLDQGLEELAKFALEYEIINKKHS